MFLIKTAGDRASNCRAAHCFLLTAETDVSQSAPGITAHGKLTVPGDQRHSPGNCFRIDAFVEKVCIPLFQVFQHRAVFGCIEKYSGNARFDPFRISFVILVDLQPGRMLLRIIRDQAVRTACDRRMRAVSGLFIQDRFLQELSSKERFPDLFVLIYDLYALSVIDHGAARRDDADRTGDAVQKPQLVEERQILVADRDRKRMFIRHMHTGENVRFPGSIFPVSDNMIRHPHICTDLCCFRGNGQQNGKSIIPRRNRSSVIVVQIRIEAQGVDMVTRIVLRHHDAAYDRRVK